MKLIQSLGLGSIVLGFMSCKTVQTESSDPKFGGGEHMTLGNQGFTKACPTCPEIRTGITTKAKGITLNYGQIVAFSGDFYENPTQLDEAPKGEGVLLKYKNIEAAKELFDNEVTEIQEQMKDEAAEISDNNAQFIRTFRASYVELAADNTTHFGWQNMKQYVKYHGEAIQLALQGYQAKTSVEKAEKRRIALLTNGFADHFLTDGFAAGHVRIPRAQGLQWAKTNVKALGVGTDKAAGGLAKALHDSDHRYQVGVGSKGLKVRNANGDSWLTRSDGDLYKGAGENFESATYIRLPTEAVARSVREVLDAWDNGVEPAGVYKATELVPFVDPSEEKLTETFPANIFEIHVEDGQGNSQIKGNVVMEAAGIIWKSGNAIGLTTATAKKFFAELPDIMKTFRADVTTDIKQNPELFKRLPELYRRGFENVQ